MKLVDGEVEFPPRGLPGHLRFNLKQLELLRHVPATRIRWHEPAHCSLYMILNSEMIGSRRREHGNDPLTVFTAESMMAHADLLAVRGIQRGRRAKRCPHRARRRFERGDARRSATGQAWGCMDITEPDAGSDMAALRCRGVAGRGWQLVRHRARRSSSLRATASTTLLSPAPRTPDPTDDPLSADLGGLSMFLVPAYIARTSSGRVRHCHDRRPWKTSSATTGRPLVALTFDERRRSSSASAAKASSTCCCS